jgi:hypothetical protein
VLAITLGWLGPQLLTLIVAIMLLLLPAAPDADVQNGLAAIYRDASGFPGQTPINTISSMALEWGRGGLLIAMFLLLQLLVVLFRGALSRGRDSL